jgi:nicotinamidase-related amidase
MVLAHRVEIPDWAIERGRASNHFSTIDAPRTALVVIDMQNVFMAPGEVFGNRHALDIVDAVNNVATALRAAGGLVVWTRQTVSNAPTLAMPAWQYDLSIPAVRRAVETMVVGTTSHAIHPAMAVGSADPIIDKYRYGAFTCPAGALKSVLEAHGIDTLIIAGTLTNCCCDSTARDGNMLGYKTFFLSDATAALTDEEHNAALLLLALNFADVRTTAEVVAMLEAEL